MKRLMFLMCGACAAAAALFAGFGAPGFDPVPRASAQGQTVTAVPLYRLYKIAYDTSFGSESWPPGFHFYTADAYERDKAAKYARYQVRGVAAYVLPKPAHGTVPLYRLRAEAQNYKKQPVSTKHFYTTDKAEADKAIAAGWKDEGVVGFVAPPDRGLPGTVPLYRLYRPEQYNSHTKTYGHEHTGDGDFFYTTSVEERDHALYYKTARGLTYVSQGVAAYVWPGPAAVAMSAPAAPLPDLTVPKVLTKETSVEAVVLNQGKHNVSGAPGLLVRFVVSDRAGKVVYQKDQQLGGLSPGQWRPVTFDTTQLKSTVGLNYRVLVDPSNVVKESSDSNNAADGIWGLKIKTDPNAAGRVPAPLMTIAGVQAAPTQGQPKHTAYRLAVSNSDAYDAAWFQSLKNVLAASPCGAGNTDARMLVRFSVIRGGATLNAGCKPLNAPQDVRDLTLDSAAPLAGADRVQVTLVDRLTNMKYASEPYAVGWFGVGDVLKTAGCKYFLGRAGSYLCTTDQGMAACENLRQQGRPIQCTRAGKQQD